MQKKPQPQLVEGKPAAVRRAIVVTDVNEATDWYYTVSDLNVAYGAPFLRNVLIKFIYSTLLLSLDREDFLSFWKRHPLKINHQTYSAESKFSHFWNVNAKTPLYYFCQVLRDVAVFYAEQDFDLPAVLKTSCEKKLFLDPEIWVGIISKYPELTAATSDAMLKLLLLLDTVVAQLCPEIKLSINAGRRQQRFTVCSVVLDTGRAEIPAFDFDATLGPIFQYLPLRFGLPCYESINCYAHRQTALEHINGVSGRECGRSAVFIEKEFGHRELFTDFARRCGFSAGATVNEGQMVFVADRDYYCHTRKRVVLKKDKAYGAPVYLFTISHQHPGSGENSIMSSLGREVRFPCRTIHGKIAHLHHELLNYLQKGSYFRYNQATDSIYSNNEFITSGTQARLLREIVQLHLSTGKTRFECREFTRKENLICSPENTGFAVRLGRIQDLLFKCHAPVAIRKEKRGTFSLVIKTKIQLVFD